MKFLSTILFLIVLLSSEKIDAQNYFYVNWDISDRKKINIKSQIKYAATLFEMQDVRLQFLYASCRENLMRQLSINPIDRAAEK